MGPVTIILKFLIVFHSLFITSYTLVLLLADKQPWLVDALGYVLPWLFLPSLVFLPAAALLRSRRFSPLALVPVIIFIALYGVVFLPQRAPETTGVPFTVMTFNVWDMNNDDRTVVQEIRVHQPDLVGLQEVRPEMAQALERHLATNYPYVEFTPELGILSKWPLLDVTAFQLGGDGHWALKTRVKRGRNYLTIFNAHLRSPRLRSVPLPVFPFGWPVGFATADRDRDIADLLRQLEHTDGPILLVGDLNLTYTTAGYRALTERLTDAHRQSGWGLGFTRSHNPRQGIPTWRIDHVFFSSELTALRTFTGSFAGSDHLPVIAEMAFRYSPAGGMKTRLEKAR